jgi:hypothetical protein
MYRRSIQVALVLALLFSLGLTAAAPQHIAERVGNADDAASVTISALPRPTPAGVEGQLTLSGEES